ncbi:cupin domain-containing protein [Belliella marina]|uniref:Cupin domain-containing protein n=1 Tax=Belliella marina TaxID=1644146 RepID=A0ABW4VL70_9BACT
MSQKFWLFGTQLHILADEHHTDSAYDLIEGQFPANIETPLHMHTKYTEQIYVLEGEFTIYLNKEEITLTPGEHLFILPNTPHVVGASGKKVNRALTIATPSGFAKLIKAVGIPGSDPTQKPSKPNDMGLFIELSKETGDVILGSPGARP